MSVAPNARQAALLETLRSDPTRGFDGDELERLSGLKQVGASADWLVRHGHAISFVGGVGPARTFWQLAPRSEAFEAAASPADPFEGLAP